MCIRQSQTQEVSDFKNQFCRNRLAKAELSGQSYYMDLVWVVCVCDHPYTQELSYISIPHFTGWSLYVREQCSRSKLEQYEAVSRNPTAPRSAAAWGHSAEEVPLLTAAGTSRGEMPLCRLFCWRATPQSPGGGVTGPTSSCPAEAPDAPQRVFPPLQTAGYGRMLG